MDEADRKKLDALNKAKESEKALQKKDLEEVLARVSDLLLLFSGDSRLTYPVDERGEQFVLDPERKEVRVPLAFFTSYPYRESRFLFHLYTALALYPDWARCPEGYLHRGETFAREEGILTSAFLEKAKEAGLSDDPAYQKDVVYRYMTSELLSFFEGCDLYASILMVFLRAPMYEDPAQKKDLAKMLLLEDLLPHEDNPTQTHRDLAGLLLTREFWGEDEMENEDVKRMFREPVLGRARFLCLREELSASLLRGEPVTKRDAIIRMVLLPCFLELFRGDLQRTELSATVKLQDGEAKREAARKKRGAPSAKNMHELLQKLDEAKRQRAVAAKELLSGRRDLTSFGVTAEDQNLFAHYERLVRPEREKMKAFWKKLLGDTSREVSVPVTGVPKGTLSVEALIDRYPDLVEAERQQNYKNLLIFDTTHLQKISRVLPRFLDISFVMDSSGSMRGEKLAPARQALAICLLSLEDFAGYLSQNAAVTHEPCAVRTEVWLYGTAGTKILSFSDQGDKRAADRILSLARLDGSRGSTDDGGCLKQVMEKITPEMIREQKAGRRIRLVFVVTDGASSFPGTAKKAVEALEETGALVQGIGIGDPQDAAALAAFRYVYGDRGLYLGKDAGRLPDALLSALRENIGGVLRQYFRRSEGME